MADAVLTGSFDTSRIKRGVADVEKGQRRMRKSNRNTALGFLEVTRAVEDFSVAGMRGALNNIPGIAMGLGLGMGVAGTASLAAVALMAVHKSVTKVNDTAAALADNAYFEKFASHLYKLQHSKAMESIAGKLQLIKDNAVELSGLSGVDTMLGLTDTKAREQRNLQFENRLASIKGGDSPAERLQREKRVLDEEIGRQLAAYDKLTEDKKKLDAEVAKAKEAQDEKEYKRLQRAVALADAEVARLKEFTGKGAGTKDISGLDKLLAGIDPNSALFDRMADMQSDAANALSTAEATLRKKKTELDVAKALAAEQEKALTALDASGKANDKNRESLERQLELNRERIGQIITEKDALEAAAYTKQRMKEFGTPRSGEAFVSSLGRRGLAASESQAAKGMLSLSKQMLKELKNISRNTRNIEVGGNYL